MMGWMKSHKIIVALLIVVVFLFFKDNLISPIAPLTNRSRLYESAPNTGYSPELDLIKTSLSIPQAQVANNSDRMAIQESNMSLFVANVRKIGDKILSFAKNNGGYMVYASYARPTESSFANIVIRIPAIKLDQALSYFRGLAVKVTSENLIGTDVTEEYTDIEAGLSTLRKTQAKFEEILDKAIDVQDILAVQRELINLQSQIDSLIGQQKAMEKNAELTRITLYLSTDELALPYTPDDAFRPDVIFKQAVRNLLNTLRVGAEALIWTAVYSPVIIFVILIYVLFKRWKRRKNPASN